MGTGGGGFFPLPLVVLFIIDLALQVDEKRVFIYKPGLQGLLLNFDWFVH